jgi:hypothetical protein
MSLLRLALIPVAALALVAPGQAATTALKAPTGVHAFLADKQSGEPTFSRTPSFAWNPVHGAAKYELALSTSPLFASSGLVWDDATVTTPVAAVPIALPWITGNPHSLYARVRSIGATGAVGPWSRSFGFDMRWTGDGVPTPLPAANGLVRWSPIDGATSYQVWFLNTNLMGSGRSKIFTTTTNAADEREYYTFHAAGSYISNVYWRVRAVRRTDFTPSNKLPAVSYGPWSPVYASVNSAFQTGPFANLSTLAEPALPGHDPAQDGYQLMPAFLFSGDRGFGSHADLYRVYVFSDEDCVNPVFQGAAVGSPAYVPRGSGPTKLPATTDELAVARLYNLLDGAQTTASATGENVVPTEGTSPSTFTAVYVNQQTSTGSSGGDASSSSGSSSSGSGSSSSSSAGAPSSSSSSTGIVFPQSVQSVGAPIDLWDTNAPKGHYYWTVVPVYWAIAAEPLSSLAPPTSGSSGGQPLVYWDGEIPQDACQSGREDTFGKASEQAATADPVSRVPYVWGLSPRGTLRAATVRTPKVYGSPLIAWEPALGASAYEVQWSKTAYPWRPQGNLFTFSTSTTLQLKPGKWYYRVRGIDFALPSGATQMAWSNKVAMVVAKPKFQVVKGK